MFLYRSVTNKSFDIHARHRIYEHSKGFVLFFPFHEDLAASCIGWIEDPSITLQLPDCDISRPMNTRHIIIRLHLSLELVTICI